MILSFLHGLFWGLGFMVGAVVVGYFLIKFMSSTPDPTIEAPYKVEKDI